MTPTIKQLKYLIALDEHLHFGKASAACFISQSAFSIAIKELETALNVQLVDRTNKSVVITEAGRAVITQARHCIRDLDLLMSIASSEQEPLSGKLTLGVIPTIAPFLLPPLIPEVVRQFPKLQLFLREDKTAVIHEQLLDGKLDLILVALPFQMRGVTVMPLFEDPFLLACSRNSRWIDGKSTRLELAALPDESILLLEDGHCLRDHALAACHLRNADQINRFAATSLQTLLQMVVADLGITFVPAMARDSLTGGSSELELHPLSEQNCREIGLAWRKGSSRGDEFSKIGALIQQLHQQ